MKLLSGLFLTCAAEFETFDELTNQLPTDLPAAFDCDGTGERIVGGELADNPWPFYVQFWQWKDQTQGQNSPNDLRFFSCGGAIVHDRFILTGNFF